MTAKDHMDNKKATSLYEYIRGRNLTGAQGIIKLDDDRMVLTQVYSHEGHDMLTDEITFDGYRAIKILARHKGRDDIFYLSPIMPDHRKVGPELDMLTISDLCCPVAKTPLPRIAPCGCTMGAFYRQVFLDPSLSEEWSIGFCDAYGCTRSFLRDESEIISEMLNNLLWSQYE